MAAAYEKLTGMNDASKGGSKYLTEKITNARDALVDVPPEEEEPPKEESKRVRDDVGDRPKYVLRRVPERTSGVYLCCVLSRSQTSL